MRDDTRQPADCAAPEFSEDALAARFADQYSDLVRYVAAWRTWMIWLNDRWVPERTLKVFDLVRATCRAAATEARRTYGGDVGDRLARTLASAHTVAAVERLARADRKHAAIASQWADDPWVFNVPMEHTCGR